MDFNEDQLRQHRKLTVGRVTYPDSTVDWLLSKIDAANSRIAALEAENKALSEKLERAATLLDDTLPLLPCEDRTQSNLITAIGEFVDVLKAYKEGA